MRLHFFKPYEFRNWQDDMSDELVARLDCLRGVWGDRIRISAAEGSLGRHSGRDDTSQHNFDKWREVRAVDVMVDGVRSVADAEEFVRLATEIGFTGIGVYPNWRPMYGFHLDVREDKKYGEPALWGRIGAKYVSIEEAFDELERVIDDLYRV